MNRASQDFVSLACFCILLFSPLCGCSTAQPRTQKSPYARLREIEKDNEYSMSRLNEAFKDLDELQKISRSFPSRQTQFIDRRLEVINKRRLKHAQQLRDVLIQYGIDVGDERALYIH